MVSEGILRVAIFGLGSTIVLLVILLFSHRAVVESRRWRYRTAVETSKRLLVQVISGGEPASGALAQLVRLPVREQIDVLAELATAVSGRSLQRLTALARDLGLISKAERRCHSRLWWRRLRAARLLTLLGGGGECVPELFDDPRDEIRAQAAEWAADHPTNEVIDRLMTMLADPSTLCRFTVEDSLLRLGRQTSRGLAHAIAGELPERGMLSALHVARGIGDERFASVAIGRCLDPRAPVRAAAARVVGAVGGREGVATLTSLLEDEDADVRTAAAEALGHLGHWPSGGELLARLRDVSWEVRRAAALSLRSFGPPGIMLLRRAVTDQDRFAADMATQVLDLPDTAIKVSG